MVEEVTRTRKRVSYRKPQKNQKLGKKLKTFFPQNFFKSSVSHIVPKNIGWPSILTERF